MRHRLARLLLAVLLMVLPAAPVARADEGWIINSFDASIQVQVDGSLRIVETLMVDFRGLEKHGIFRDIPVVYDYDDEHERVYDLNVVSVTDANGRRHQYETSTEGGYLRFRIGDPDATLSGSQSYVITYTVAGALNPFPEHDELYWNATGPWPVAMDQVTVRVELPGEGIQDVACFQGPVRSTERCPGSVGGRFAEFRSTRMLPEDEELTIVVGFDKGIIPAPKPILKERPRDFEEFFEVTPVTVGGGALSLVAVVGSLGWAWSAYGRDRKYLTVHYLTDDTREGPAPFTGGNDVVIEYEPPEKLRPAMMGLLLDESADTLDATATIIDLAVRGHLHIAEVDQKFLGHFDFGSNDWRFTRRHNPDDRLAPYEAKLLEGLFQDGDEALLTDLKTKFHSYLSEAQDLLYDEAHQRKYFPQRPDRVRTWWVGIGIGIGAVGAVLVFGLGAAVGAGLIAVPVVLGGVLTLVMAKFMPRRTALGREMLRRTLGFRKYVSAAETERQRYNEQARIFGTYLPYAMVFGCVDKWAKNLSVLATAEGSQSAAPYYSGWYTGNALIMNPGAFSDSMRGLSKDISSVIVSTPGGSGGTGFSSGGGFSGGGGGGGGGGSW